MQAPTRPVSAGEVEAYSTNSDFPARSFFNIYVEVDIPAAGPLPAVQLVNVQPLLVENAVIYGFPPRAFYIHGNTNAVPVYFNRDFTITNNNGSMTVPRGTLFGQLTLAGHGMNYASYEIASFETEMETETQTPMPLTANPFFSVAVPDPAPNYNAIPAARLSRSYVSNGVFFLTVTTVTPHSTNFVQTCDDLRLTNWVTISTNVPSTNVFNFTEPSVGTFLRRFFRVRQVP